MSQTVEFEYAIGDTVKITENGPALGCLGIVEVRKQGRTRIQYNVAYPADMSLSSYTNRRWFDECYLAPRASAGSTVPEAPAATSKAGVEWRPYIPTVGDRVTVDDRNSYWFGRSGHVVGLRKLKGGPVSWPVVVFGGTGADSTFQASQLKRLPPEQHASDAQHVARSDPASVPVFPRTIWQSGPIPTRLEEELGDDDERPHRLVQVAANMFIDEVYGRDAMGVRRWRALAPSADWLRDAIVEKLERQEEAAELRRQAKLDGSDQNP